MWKYKAGDRVALGQRTGTVTRQLMQDHYVNIEWDDGAEEGHLDDTLSRTDKPAPKKPDEVW